MPEKVFIRAVQSISALGSSSAEVWNSYKEAQPHFHRQGSDDEPLARSWVSRLRPETSAQLDRLRQERSQYQQLDPTVLMAMLAAGKAIEKVGGAVKDTGLNLGSSRGATTLFEKFHQQFIKDRNVSVYSSPTTTLGNISAWTAQYLGLEGPAIDHSITCSTGLHALVNGIAWIRAGMARRFICGGTEAALTPFTIAQMKALRLYSNSQNSRPCESMRFEKKANTMVLGEAAAVVLLEGQDCTHPIAEIKGIGFASEPLNSLSSISADAQSLQRSMTTAMQEAGIREVDAVVMHAPGTVKGDLAEKEAIDRVFGSHLPLLTSNKWQVGHTFAASGPLSIEMAVMMIANNHFVENPFYANRRHLPKTLDTVMVNAVGFGGNAVSIIIGKV